MWSPKGRTSLRQPDQKKMREATATAKPADVSEPVRALGTQNGSRFVDWAARLSVSKVHHMAHLGLCSPAQDQSVADRSLSGSFRFPEVSRDNQRVFTQSLIFNRS